MPTQDPGEGHSGKECKVLEGCGLQLGADQPSEWASPHSVQQVQKNLNGRGAPDKYSLRVGSAGARECLWRVLWPWSMGGQRRADTGLGARWKSAGCESGGGDGGHSHAISGHSAGGQSTLEGPGSGRPWHGPMAVSLLSPPFRHHGETLPTHLS